MIKESKILDRDKLEKLLISRWADFLDIRKLLKFAKNISDMAYSHSTNTIKNIKISRFELKENGFIIWLETTFLTSSNLSDSTQIVNTTYELFLDFQGTIEYIQSI